jgi:hypothetical protein
MNLDLPKPPAPSKPDTGTGETGPPTDNGQPKGESPTGKRLGGLLRYRSRRATATTLPSGSA